MNHFTAEDTFIIVGIVIAYILFTTWLTFRIRSKNSGDFMEGSRAMPAFIVGILLMSEYIGAKSTIGTAQAAFESGIAASWSVLGAAIGFPLFGLILVKRIYNTGKITISGAIAEKYGNSTKNIISLIMIYALLLVNVGNYVSGAAAISTVLKVNLPVAAFITAIVSTFYFAFGGMKGVAWVTMLHSALKYAGLLIILGFALSKTGGFSPMMGLSFRPLAQPKTFGQRNAPPGSPSFSACLSPLPSPLSASRRNTCIPRSTACMPSRSFCRT